VVPAAYVLLTRDGPAGPEVLLQLRGPETTYMAGHWATAAAGHVEAGESVLEAAVREAREELGVEIDPAALTPLCAMHRTDPGNPAPIEQRVDFFFLARAWSGDPTIQEPGKCVDLRWVSPADLPGATVPHERAVLELLAAEDVPAVVTFGFGPVGVTGAASGKVEP
jgi:8-oxo-dGTP pyrophosphatase MutT (NUDIX family)